MADGDDDDPAIVFFVISALIVLIFVACFKRWLDLRKNREDDREELEPRDLDVEADGHSQDNSRNGYGYANPTVPAVLTGVEKFTARAIPSINRLLPLRRAPDTVRVPVPDNQNNDSIYTISRGHQQRRSQSVPGRSSRRIAEDRSSPDFKILQGLQLTLKDKAAILDTMREAQLRILRRQQPPTEESLQTTLVIGVDATPKAYGGYCVNLRTRSLEFYIIKAKEFPWSLQNQNDPNEFEMKNLQYALCVWSKGILKYKKFRVYTDNNSICNAENEFGVDANELLDHFTGCADADLVNEQMHVNRKQKVELFAKYIQPADDFSRWEIEEGVDFLCQYYGIERSNVRGTYQLTRPANEGSKPWYDPTGFHSQKLQRATTFSSKFQCENCIIDVFGRPETQETRTSSRRSRRRSRSRSRRRGISQQRFGNGNGWN